MQECRTVSDSGRLRPALAAALGLATLLSVGCSGSDNPASNAGTIDLPKKEPAPFNPSDFTKKAQPQPKSN